MKIRDETEADIESITEITKQAFENHPFSRNTEQFIIHAARRQCADGFISRRKRWDSGER
jgi:putative acetyltransferase